MRRRLEIDLNEVVNKLNETGNKTQTCIHFGLSDNSLTPFLSKRGYRVVKRYTMLNEDGSRSDIPSKDPKIAAFMKELNRSKNKARSCSVLEIHPGSLFNYLKARKLKIKLQFELEEIPEDELQDAEYDFSQNPENN